MALREYNPVGNKKNYTVLVTGGAGYIGSHIVLNLCEHGHNVTVFDNLSTGHEINIDSRAEFKRGDILNKDQLEDIFSKPYNAVFHCAALKSVEDSMLDPGKYASVNVSGTINVLNQMMKNNISNMIFSSTAAVYGIPEYLPVDENHPLKPINFYGFTKLEIEKLLHWYSELKGLKYAVLRYFNAAGYDSAGRIVGLETKPENLLPIVMQTAMGTRNEIKIFGNDYNTSDGTGIRDYIHVTDLATAHIKAMEFIIEKNNNLCLNLATGVGYSVMDVINKAKEVTGKTIKYQFTDRRPGDTAELVALSKFSFDTINWRCENSDIQSILESMWNVYND